MVAVRGRARASCWLVPAATKRFDAAVSRARDFDVSVGVQSRRYARQSRRLATRTIDATGHASAFGSACNSRARRRPVTVGGSAMDQRLGESTDLVSRQLDIRGSQLGANQYEACISVLAAGRYPLEPLVSHRFGLSALEEAMLTFEARGTCIKPVIVFE